MTFELFGRKWPTSSAYSHTAPHPVPLPVNGERERGCSLMQILRRIFLDGAVANSLSPLAGEGWGEGPPRNSALAGADMRDRFDLDLDRRIGQCRYLHQGRGREIAGEEFAAGLPHLLALAEVGGEERHLDDIGHRAAGRLDEVTNLGEDRRRLGVFIAQLGTPRCHAGEVGDASSDEAVGPSAGSWLGDIRGRGAYDAAHELVPLRADPA